VLVIGMRRSGSDVDGWNGPLPLFGRRWLLGGYIGCVLGYNVSMEVARIAGMRCRMDEVACRHSLDAIGYMLGCKVGRQVAAIADHEKRCGMDEMASCHSLGTLVIRRRHRDAGGDDRWDAILGCR
jgi:hypothetical protein